MCRRPAFAWDRLDPVAAHDTVRLFGTEVNHRGAVDMRFGGRWRIALAARARFCQIWVRRSRKIVCKRRVRLTRGFSRLHRIAW